MNTAIAAEAVQDPPAEAAEDSAKRRQIVEGARQIFLAVYGPEGRSHAEVARDLGLSVQRVRQALCEVRARVRAALRETESGD